MKPAITEGCKWIVAAGALVFFSALSQAALVAQVGQDVSFTYDDSSLYGTGFVVGNSLLFSPTGFSAESLNTGGAVVTTATLNISVEVNAGSGQLIGGFQVAEGGDYLLSGNSAAVSAAGRLQVTSETATCPLFACMATDLVLAGALTQQGNLTEWNMAGTVDLASVAGWGSDTRVLAQLQNVLTATSLVNGELAFVQKKFIGIGAQTIPAIPVPAAAWLFGSALVGLAGLRRARVA